jgi:hypothetical protein
MAQLKKRLPEDVTRANPRSWDPVGQAMGYGSRATMGLRIYQKRAEENIKIYHEERNEPAETKQARDSGC